MTLARHGRIPPVIDRAAEPELRPVAMIDDKVATTISCATTCASTLSSWCAIDDAMDGGYLVWAHRPIMAELPQSGS